MTMATAKTSPTFKVDDATEKVVERTNHVYNVNQTLITVSEDRLTVIVYECLRDRSGKNDWLAPAGAFIGILLVLVTTNFRDTGPITAADWQVIMIILVTLFGAWTIKLFPKSIRSWRSNPENDIVRRAREDSRDQ